MSLWSTIVAERLGFSREEALSIGAAYTEMNAISKGASLGIYKEKDKIGLEAVKGGAQPYVELMGRRMSVVLIQFKVLMTDEKGPVDRSMKRTLAPGVLSPRVNPSSPDRRIHTSPVPSVKHSLSLQGLCVSSPTRS